MKCCSSTTSHCWEDNNMIILAIHGSMRKGNTYRLTKEVISRISSYPDVKIVEFGVADLNLPFCCSCHICFNEGEEYCPHSDSLRDLREALLECDGIILSGTTYMWSLNGAMKNLLDHFAYLFHRPVLFGKKGMVIATSAGNGEKGVAKYLKGVLGQWGVNGAIALTQNTKAHMMQGSGDVFSSTESAEIDRATRKFYELIKSKKPIPPSAKSIAVHNAFRVSSLSEFAQYGRDTEFWHQNGYVDKPYPARAGFFKAFIGAFVFSAAKNATAALGRIYKKKIK